jgi:hypothetical protein
MFNIKITLPHNNQIKIHIKIINKEKRAIRHCVKNLQRKTIVALLQLSLDPNQLKTLDRPWPSPLQLTQLELLIKIQAMPSAEVSQGHLSSQESSSTEIVLKQWELIINRCKEGLTKLAKNWKESLEKKTMLLEIYNKRKER